MNSYDHEWIKAAKAAGHVLRKDEGKVDWFVMDSGFHNGPGCSKCGKSWCQWCTSPSEIEPCQVKESNK